MEPVVPLTESGAADNESAAAADARLLNLLEQYGALLRRTIIRVCPRELGLSCDDIEQEARISLWTALKREREIEFPASYIYRVAVTATLRAIRRAKARREDLLPDVAPEDGSLPAARSTERFAAPAEASPHALAERGEVVRNVEAAVAELPEPRSVAVRLHLQGLSTREIGELLGWTEAKARNLVHRGLKSLRQSLRARGIEDRLIMRKMNEEEIRAIWRQRPADGSRSACLTEGEWARLLSKEAEGDERARAATHIASCKDCADEFRLLQPLQSWSAELERVVSPHAAAASQRSRSWLAWLTLPSPALAIAAALVLVVTQAVGVYLLVGSRRANVRLESQLAQNERALSSAQTSLTEMEAQLRNRSAASEEQVQALQQRLAQRSAPQLDAVIAELTPRDGGVVRGASDTVVTTTPTGSIATLILTFEPLAARSTLEVEVLDEGGQVRWTGRTERERGADAVTLALPTEGYAPGTYAIRLFDVTHGRRPVSTYRVILRNAPDTPR